MPSRITCWRCKQITVAFMGVPCASCRAILESEYAIMRAVNNDRDLVIPKDWDGFSDYLTHDAVARPRKQRSRTRRSSYLTPSVPSDPLVLNVRHIV